MLAPARVLLSRSTEDLPRQRAVVLTGQSHARVLVHATSHSYHVHSYVILLYTQPATFTAPDGLNTEGVAISSFDLNGYVKVHAQ